MKEELKITPDLRDENNDGALTICPPTFCLRYSSTHMVRPNDILSHVTIYYCFFFIEIYHPPGQKVDILSHVLGRPWATNGTSTLQTVYRTARPPLLEEKSGQSHLTEIYQPID